MVNVPQIWLDEIKAGTAFGLKAQRVLSAMPVASPSTNRHAPTKQPISLIGIAIRALWEMEIGYVITCGSCLAYLHSIKDADTTNRPSLYKQLLTHLPTPEWWRQKYRSRSDKLSRLEELLADALPTTIHTPLVAESPVSSDAKWAVVLTTAKRTIPTLNKCVASIRSAGWEPTIFAEPNSLKIDDVDYHQNNTVLGAWHNWLASANWALKETTAEYIMTVQDDTLFHPDSKALAEKILWPSDTTGFVSLYTAKHYSENKAGIRVSPGVHKIATTNLWGACALIFPRAALQLIVDHPLTAEWVGPPPTNLTDKQKQLLIAKKTKQPSLIKNVDTLIGRVLTGLHLDMYVVVPSPVTHIAAVSAIGHGSNTGRRNCSQCSDHSKPLIPQVLTQ